MAFLFGKNKKPKKSDKEVTQDVINNNAKIIENLEKKQAQNTKKIAQLKQQAVEEKKKGNNKKAVSLYKQMKFLETQQERLQAMSFNLKATADVISQAEFEKEIMEQMKATKQVIQNQIGDADNDQIYDVMDELSEVVALADERSAALAREIQVGPAMDEDEIDQELEALAGEVDISEEPAPAKTRVSTAPAQPANDEDELGDLMAQFC